MAKKNDSALIDSLITQAPEKSNLCWFDRLPEEQQTQVLKLCEAFRDGKLPAHISSLARIHRHLEESGIAVSTSTPFRVWYRTRILKNSGDQNGSEK